MLKNSLIPIWCIAKYNYKKLFYSPRLYILLILQCIYLWYLISPIISFSKQIGIRVTPLLFSHITSYKVSQMIIMLGVIILFSDSPFIDIPENIGIIIENPGFLPNYSGMNNLKLLAMIKNKIGNKEIEAAIKRVGLDPDNKKHVSKYSLGMRQRLGLAQAIMEEPEIYILDEPMNGLDKSGIKEIRSLLLDLKAEGKTIIMATHIMEDVKILCDSIYLVEDGIVKLVENI